MIWERVILILAMFSGVLAKDINPRMRRDMKFRTHHEYFHPCKEMMGVLWVMYTPGLPPGEENQYELYVRDFFWHKAVVDMEFDSEASFTLLEPISSRISTRKNRIYLDFFEEADKLRIQVRGPATGTIPYVKSVSINTFTRCENATTGYLDNEIIGYQNTAEIRQKLPDDTCGRRKVTHTELIVSGQPTKPGDWPWHAAIYRLDGSNVNYICGGTLISKTLVLTAAHCVTVRGVPVLTEALKVVLGKYNLIGGDDTTQEREVHEIVVQDEFNYRVLNNDIALLKLRTEALFDDYVQPVCLWHTNAYKKLPAGDVIGTVVGWGFDQTDKLSSKLQQAYIPKVSEAVCIKSNPTFFSRVLTPQKFCAGIINGSTACNGDSGGGFSIFVPDISGDASPNATGAWYVHGIVSMTVSRRDAPICDPGQYVVFTDIAKYDQWLLKYIK